MVWSTQFFLFKARRWKELQDIVESRMVQAPTLADRGAVAYAEGQISFWMTMANRADQIFQLVDTNYASVI